VKSGKGRFLWVWPLTDSRSTYPLKAAGMWTSTPVIQHAHLQSLYLYI
jgi:hypothetical protein